MSNFRLSIALIQFLYPLVLPYLLSQMFSIGVTEIIGNIGWSVFPKAHSNSAAPF